MKATHGGKVENVRVDTAKLAGLLRSGMFPMAYVYARDMRETRDLLRRRAYFVRQKAQLIAHSEADCAAMDWELLEFEGVWEVMEHAWPCN